MTDVNLRRFKPDAIETTTYGASLGLGTADGLIQRIKEGLPADSFVRLQERLGISQKELAHILNINPRTLSRRLKTGHFEADESERLWRIAQLFDRAKEVLGSEENARRWLTSPRPYLNGATPLAYADTEPGAKVVERLLGRIEYGVIT